jgi:hypothetical protein
MLDYVHQGSRAKHIDLKSINTKHYTLTYIIANSLNPTGSTGIRHDLSVYVHVFACLYDFGVGFDGGTLGGKGAVNNK